LSETKLRQHRTKIKRRFLQIETASNGPGRLPPDHTLRRTGFHAVALRHHARNRPRTLRPGIAKEHYGTPLGSAVSLGIHESQSCLWENHVGRSETFWQHWHPVACIGYFPTYSFGNLNAAQLMNRALTDCPTLDTELARGEYSSVLNWLREKVHRQGMRHQPQELMRLATGEALYYFAESIGSHGFAQSSPSFEVCVEIEPFARTDPATPTGKR
jgi:Carboxypeptidase Taq (M32) metallopeptidase